MSTYSLGGSSSGVGALMSFTGAHTPQGGDMLIGVVLIGDATTQVSSFSVGGFALSRYKRIAIGSVAFYEIWTAGNLPPIATTADVLINFTASTTAAAHYVAYSRQTPSIVLSTDASGTASSVTWSRAAPSSTLVVGTVGAATGTAETYGATTGSWDTFPTLTVTGASVASSGCWVSTAATVSRVVNLGSSVSESSSHFYFNPSPNPESPSIPAQPDLSTLRLPRSLRLAVGYVTPTTGQIWPRGAGR